MFVAVDLSSHRSLCSMLSPLLDAVKVVESFDLTGEPYDRRKADAVITLKVTHDHGSFGVIYNDFKVKGGSFSRANSERLAAFIDEMSAQHLPTVFLVDSMGVRLMDGRALVKPAFSVIPRLLRYREDHLLITCNAGRALGLGAVLYAAGHYRMAVAGRSVTNLAGPEIMRMFFGEAQAFATVAAPEHQPPGGTLVNELAPSRSDMLARAGALIESSSGWPPPPLLSSTAADFPSLAHIRDPEAKLADVLAAISDVRTELFERLSPSVRIYLASRHGRRFGVFINPPGNPDNLITAHTLDKYTLGLDLFRVMRLPIVSFLDTPGGDPRDNSDAILKLLYAVQRVAAYPYRRMGVCIGRGYGGAIALGFPKFLGAEAAYVLEGAAVGLMHAQLIESLLATSKNLAAEWQATKGTQTAECTDLIAAGIIDGVLAPGDLVRALDRFLAGA
jgi:acetyl-CoA carboxylase carboxyltransferase component